MFAHLLFLRSVEGTSTIVYGISFDVINLLSELHHTCYVYETDLEKTNDFLYTQCPYNDDVVNRTDLPTYKHTTASDRAAFIFSQYFS